MNDINQSLNTSIHNTSVLSIASQADHHRARSATEMPFEEMYKLTHRGIPWGIEGYETPKEYLDPKLLAKIREGKFRMQAPKPTKRGLFLDDLVKRKMSIPGPDRYSTRIEKKIAPSKIKNPSRRMTFIDGIFYEGNKRPTPGPSSYKTIKDDKDIQAQLEKLRARSQKENRNRERGNFVLNIQFVAAKVPGPGMYDPSPITTKRNENKTNPEYWRQKHNSQNQPLKLPGVGSYNPIPTAFDTFQKYIRMSENKLEFKRKNSMNMAERFKKPKEIQKPGPAEYNITSIWPGKSKRGEKQEKATDFLYKISKGPEISFYYK